MTVAFSIGVLEAGGPGFQIPLSVPQNHVGCPIFATKARALFASFAQKQRVGYRISPCLKDSSAFMAKATGTSSRAPVIEGCRFSDQP
jgi:hypothetical protein